MTTSQKCCNEKENDYKCHVDWRTWTVLANQKSVERWDSLYLLLIFSYKKGFAVEKKPFDDLINWNQFSKDYKEQKTLDKGDMIIKITFLNTFNSKVIHLINWFSYYLNHSAKICVVCTCALCTSEDVLASPRWLSFLNRCCRKHNPILALIPIENNVKKHFRVFFNFLWAITVKYRLSTSLLDPHWGCGRIFLK